MKITGVRHRAYRARLDRRIGDANGPVGSDDGSGAFVFVDTDDGLTGIAPTSILDPGSILQSLEGELLGQDPRGVIGLWVRLCDRAFKRGVRGATRILISALDVALWDLKAKAHDEPLWRTLGGVEPRVRAYASGIDMSLSDEDLRTFYRRMASLGIGAGKLKVGLDPEADHRRLGIVRDELSQVAGQPLLMIDSNEYWSPKQAISAITELERTYDLFWVEEPARRWDARGLRRVSSSVRAAVATGENLDGAADFAPLLLEDAADIYQVSDLTSGITGALQVAAMCAGFERPIAMVNCPGDFMAHAATIMPNHIVMEVVEAGWAPFVTVAQRIEGGWIILGDAPGIGISVDETAWTEWKPRDGADAWQDPQPFGRRRGAGLWVEPPTAEERARRDLGRSS
jgi:L-alanine-DL-glutamate epimerase-like enolase superfamily enzyme